MTKEEKLKEYNKRYYQENKKRLLAKQKQYNAEHKEERKQWREDHKEEKVEYDKQYSKTQKGRSIYLCKNYKQDDKNANRGECTLTSEWIIDNIFTSKCVYCGESDWRKLGCDRIDNDKPHTPDNVVCSCWECNNNRGAKSFDEFLAFKKGTTEVVPLSVI